MHRKQIVGLCLAVVVCALALNSIRCKDNCTGQPGVPTAHPAMVRFIHASPDAPAVDCAFDSTVFVAGSTFNTYLASTCCYRPCVATGKGTVFVRLSTGGTILASDTATFKEDEYYTVVLMNHRAAAQILVLHDTLTTPPPTEARLRMIDAVTDQSALDFTLSGKRLITGLRFGKASPYVTVVKPAGTDTGSFFVTREGTNDVIYQFASGALFIPGKYVITMVMLGSMTPNGTEPLPTMSMFQDNVASVHGLGDVLFQPTYGGLRALNATGRNDTLDAQIFNAVSSTFPPDWRYDFPGQSRMLKLPPDSLSDYLLLGFNGLDKDPQGRYQTAVRFVRNGTFDALSDSLHVDPFEKDRRYTFVAIGDVVPFSVVQLFDTASTPPSGMSSIRLLNGSPDNTQPISLSVDGLTPFSNIAYKGVTGMYSVPAGAKTITLQPASGASTTVTATLQSGEVYTVVAMGKNSNGTLHGKVFLK